MKASKNKIFLEIGGVPIFARTLAVFERSAAIDEIVVVAHPDEIEYFQHTALKTYQFSKITRITSGGTTRRRSEMNALNTLRQRIAHHEIDLLLVHDGARPFTTEAMIDDVLGAAENFGGAIAAIPELSGDEIFAIDSSGSIQQVFLPGSLWNAQTPQAFRAAELLDAYDAAERDNFDGTDTASCFERSGRRVKVVRGSGNNIKITTPEDLAFAEHIIANNPS